MVRLSFRVKLLWELIGHVRTGRIGSSASTINCSPALYPNIISIISPLCDKYQKRSLVPTKTRLDFSQRKEILGLLLSLPAASSWVCLLVAPTRAPTALISRMPPSSSTSGNSCRSSFPVPVFIGRIFQPSWLQLRLEEY